MSEFEKIDFVLNFIKEKMSISAYWGQGLIWKHVEDTKEAGINKTLFLEILNKLREDGFIVDNETKDACRVTFKGLIFKGYVLTELDNQEESQIVKNLRQRTVDLQEQMNVLTKWIVIGTLATVAVGILTLLKEYLKCS